MIVPTIKKALNLIGFDLVKKGHKSLKPVYDEYAEFIDIYESCKEYSMTGIERMYALYKSVEYIVKNKIEGNFVECGVWRGGSSMVIAKTLLKFNCTDKHLYLYDTYEGMSAPTEKDVNKDGYLADKMMKDANIEDQNSVWCFADLEDVKNNMRNTGYPFSNISFVKGKVEDTIPNLKPDNKISLLRLDTDWYESTLHEMTHLYPLLASKGVLIIDDYGHWQGARQAVDEYFDSIQSTIHLNRIDYTGRIGVKI
jgi:O-methyltransferase